MAVDAGVGATILDRKRGSPRPGDGAICLLHRTVTTHLERRVLTIEHAVVAKQWSFERIHAREPMTRSRIQERQGSMKTALGQDFGKLARGSLAV